MIKQHLNISICHTQLSKRPMEMVYFDDVSVSRCFMLTSGFCSCTPHIKSPISCFFYCTPIITQESDLALSIQICSQQCSIVRPPILFWMSSSVTCKFYYAQSSIPHQLVVIVLLRDCKTPHLGSGCKNRIFHSIMPSAIDTVLVKFLLN